IGENSTKDFYIVNANTTPLLVKNLRLRYNNAGFSILPIDWDINQPIEAGGRRKVSVRFDATKVGNFTDEIGFDDECKLAFYSVARASVGASTIGVDDIDFGQQGVLTTSNEISVLKNTGAGELVITAVSGPTNPVFTSNNL